MALLRSRHAPVQLVLTQQGAAEGGRWFGEGAVSSEEHEEVVHYERLVALSACTEKMTILSTMTHPLQAQTKLSNLAVLM
jgi:hypothetical protein